MTPCNERFGSTLVSDSGLLPGDTKPLAKPMLIFHQRCFVAFIWEQFHRKCWWTYSVTYIRKLHFWNYHHISRRLMNQCHGCWSHGSTRSQAFSRHGISYCRLNDYFLSTGQDFDHRHQCSGSKFAQLITTKFCTRHDCETVVTWAIFRRDQLNKFRIKSLQSFIEFRIRSKYN